MEYRSAITLMTGDVISIPGLGEKHIGAIHQSNHDRYQLRLDEKFVESVTVDVFITNGEHRSPERRDSQQSRKQLLDAVAAEALQAGLEGRPFKMPVENEQNPSGN